MSVAYGILVSIHSITRWFVLLAGLAGLGRYGYGWLGKKEWTANDKLLGTIFVGLMGLQTLLGLVLIFWFTFGVAVVREQWEHAITMLIALGITHLLFRYRKLDDVSKRFRNSFFTITAVFILILLGVTVIGGW
jgi:hypothetical protein